MNALQESMATMVPVAMRQLLATAEAMTDGPEKTKLLASAIRAGAEALEGIHYIEGLKRQKEPPRSSARGSRR